MKILVVCNAGMSSSILVKKIMEYAASISEEAIVEAHSSASVSEQVGKWDVCLVAPQIMYAVDDIKGKLNIPTAAVDMRAYAIADGKAAYEQAKAMKG
ncbi:PTS sugar transporter subunit IIB [Erysipelotrichaceae bacterium HCN-30851]